jgi:glycosyltransferase involved in cell wall biosynthesis
MRKILILMGRYLPGHKDGGPLRTIINVTEALGDEYEFYIACLDRDHGDTEPYSNIKIGEWNQVGKAKVWYVRPGGFTYDLILRLAEGKNLIYLSSFYDDYGYKTLLLNNRGKLNCNVALASMGVFSEAALKQKSIKKFLFINACKVFGLFTNITWSVTSELEAEDVKKVIGSEIKYVIAEDLPRMNVPGRLEKKDEVLKIVFISRICTHKNLDFAIRAIDGMKHDARLTICGPIQEKEYWNNCRKQLENVKFLWSYEGDVPSDEVQGRLAQHDVLIFPSKSENYGHVVIEALSVGCIPVISDRTPWKMLDNEKIGFELPLVEENFAKKLDLLAEMTCSERSSMADRAVIFAKEKIEQSVRKTGYRIIFG